VTKRHLLVLALCLAGACLDTHDASLGEQSERAPASPADGGAAADAGSPLREAGPDALEHADADADVEEEDEEDERDAGTSTLCRLEPWHCT
jgi:hypothetical protein